MNAAGQLMVNEVGSLLGACLGGPGVAQLLELYTRELLADGRLVQLLPELGDETYPLYAYHHLLSSSPPKFARSWTSSWR